MNHTQPDTATGKSFGGTFTARVLDGTDDPFLSAVKADNNVFQSRAFVAGIEQHMLAPSDRLALVGVTDQTGVPVAIFPFVKRRRFGVPMLEALDYGLTDYFAPVLLDDVPLSTVATARLWKAVARAVPGVHAVAFKKLPRLIHRRPHALSSADFLKPMSADATTLYLHGPDGKPVSPDKVSVAREVRRKSKKLEQVGLLTFLEAQTNAEVDAAMETLVAFRTARFSDLGRKDALLDPRVVSFYKALADRSVAQPTGRLFTLRAGEMPVAVVYGFSHKDVFTLIAPAITTCKRTQSGSPGLVALYRMLQWSSDNGYAVFDLSVGSLFYKSRFDAETVELFEYQQALTPLGLPAVAEAALRRYVRRLALKYPQLRGRMEKLERFGFGRRSQG